MIDTISFRIHDLQRHDYLVKYLTKNEISGVEDRREYLLEDQQALFLPMKWKDYTYNHGTGKTYTRAYRNSWKSHNMDINYRIEVERDFLHIEFSLCKYFHGENVHQLVPHRGDRYKDDFTHTPWYELASLGFDVFRGAFKNFIAREFGQIEIDFRFVEVVQCDLCFNYVFKSAEQLKMYLAFIREVKKKYARDEKNHSAYGPSSIYYPSKVATFKIYHKGPELDAHPGQYKRKSNHKHLRDLAYRTLRFELAFKPNAFRELWMRRSKLKPVLLAYRRWQKEGKFFYKGKWYKVGQPNGDRDKILKSGKILDRRWQFFLDGDVSEYENRAVFDRQLFKEMIEYFWMVSKKFMLRDATDLNIEASNAQYAEYYDAEGQLQRASLHGLSINRVKSLAVLLRSCTWDEVLKKDLMSRAQMYRYKKFFETVGYGGANTKQGDLTDLDNTYRRYYDALDSFEITKTVPFFMKFCYIARVLGATHIGESVSASPFLLFFNALLFRARGPPAGSRNVALMCVCSAFFEIFV